MKRKHYRIFAAVLLCIALLTVSAGADMGPKPHIGIQVQNAPQETYYLDLLVPDEKTGHLSDNLSWNRLERSSLDADIVDILEKAAQGEDYGMKWHLAMLDGTNAPMTGSLQGEDDYFSFDYHGVPDTFRIVIATADGARLSPMLHRRLLQQSYIYDYSANAVQEQNVWYSYCGQFLSSLLPTLFLEGVLLFSFGFWNRRSILVFLGVNFATQLGLTLVTVLCAGVGVPFYRYLVFLPLELVITVVETLIYRKTLRCSRPKSHPVLYAVLANALSALTTFISVQRFFPWLVPW